MAKMSDLERYYNMLLETSLLGNSDWQELSVEEITEIFRRAAGELLDLQAERREDEFKKHANLNFLVRWWKEWRGWQPTPTHTSDEIIQEMARQCRAFAERMEIEKDRPHYANLYVRNDLIDKPRGVANKILGID